MKPLYQDSEVTIYNGDALKVLGQLGPVALLLTDPPYSAKTHQGARKLDKGKVKELVDFKPFTESDLRRFMRKAQPIVARWMIMTTDYKWIGKLEDKTPEGYDFIRRGVLVKDNAAPQFTGDRPGQGWEQIAFLHRHGRRCAWNGGGRNSVFRAPVVHGGHPTEKHPKFISELIQLFTDPGDLILDPFMGSGVVLRVAKDLGRRAIGIDIDREWCLKAATRVGQGVLPLGNAELPFEPVEASQG